MNLEQASPCDFDEVFEILIENARWLSQKGVVQWPVDWLLSQRDNIRSSVGNGAYFKVVIDNETAVVVEVLNAPEEIWEKDKSSALYLHKLAIKRKYSGASLGRETLRLIEIYAIEKNVNLLRLDCVAHNSALRAYYESCDFMYLKEVSNGEVNLALYERKIGITKQ